MGGMPTRDPSPKCSAAATQKAASGAAKARFKLTLLVFRQPNSGARPISAKIRRPIGAIQRLKNGGPTVTLSFHSHSLILGNNVATNMKVMPPSSDQLLTTNI